MPSFRSFVIAGILAAFFTAVQIHSRHANAQLSFQNGGTFGGPIENLPAPPTGKLRKKSVIDENLGLGKMPAPTLLSKPTPNPVPVPAPVFKPRFPGQHVIRVGLSTAGDDISVYVPDGATFFDLDQPGLTLKIAAGGLLQMSVGPIKPTWRGKMTFRGSIVLTQKSGIAVGWQHPYLVVNGASAKVTSNGQNARYGRPYRGDLEVFPQKLAEPFKRKGPLALVNVIPIEAYLKGVVPWEMSPSAPLEALKAQAVCARTKTLQFEESKKFAAGNFDICDYDACQGYPGTENEAKSTSAAVDATKGLALYQNGKPIDAVYSTNSGGITAAARDVWKATTPITYLQSVPDFLPNCPLAQLWKGGMTEAKWAEFCSQNWLSYARPDGIASDKYEARKYRWTQFISVDDAEKTFANRGFDSVTGFEIAQRTDSGRIRQLRVVGTSKGSPVLVPDADPDKDIQATKFITIEGDGKIRAMFSGRLGSTTALPSSLFVVTPQVNAAGTLTGWMLKGAGWGHGVGMCQRGAQNHALEGWNAKRILQWYYHDVEIRKTS